jgi:hypothetical protein
VAIKSFAFQVTAAGVLTWTVPFDCQVAGFDQSGTVMLSYDKNDTIANVATPTSNATARTNLLWYSNTTGLRTLPPIPLAAGETVYVTFSAAGTAVLWVDDLSQLT